MQDCLGKGLQTYGTRHSLLCQLFLMFFLLDQRLYIVKYIQSDPREPDIFWMGSTQ